MLWDWWFLDALAKDEILHSSILFKATRAVREPQTSGRELKKVIFLKKYVHVRYQSMWDLKGNNTNLSWILEIHQPPDSVEILCCVKHQGDLWPSVITKRKGQRPSDNDWTAVVFFESGQAAKQSGFGVCNEPQGVFLRTKSCKTGR